MCGWNKAVFALGDNPFVDKLVFKKSVNLPSVESYPFTVVVGQKQKGPDSYREVYEQLLADYQNFCGEPLDQAFTRIC